MTAITPPCPIPVNHEPLKVYTLSSSCNNSSDSESSGATSGSEAIEGFIELGDITEPRVTRQTRSRTARLQSSSSSPTSKSTKNPSTSTIIPCSPTDTLASSISTSKSVMNSTCETHLNNIIPMVSIKEKYSPPLPPPLKQTNNILSCSTSSSNGVGIALSSSSSSSGMYHSSTNSSGVGTSSIRTTHPAHFNPNGASSAYTCYANTTSMANHSTSDSLADLGAYMRNGSISNGSVASIQNRPTPQLQHTRQSDSSAATNFLPSVYSSKQNIRYPNHQSRAHNLTSRITNTSSTYNTSTVHKTTYMMNRYIPYNSNYSSTQSSHLNFGNPARVNNGSQQSTNLPIQQPQAAHTSTSTNRSNNNNLSWIPNHPAHPTLGNVRDFS